MDKQAVGKTPWAACLLLSALLAGCGKVGGEADSVPGPLIFDASVVDGADLRTRSEERLDDKESAVTAESYGDNDFFIQLDYRNLSGDEREDLQGTLRRYSVASGYEGRLDVKGADAGDSGAAPEPLNWKDLGGGHTFFGWTLPLFEGDMEEKDYAVLDNYYDTGGEPTVKVRFHDSGEDAYDTYRNNSRYEKFVAAQAGPFSYRQNGSYVKLRFYHLVSKIHIRKLTLLTGGNSRQNNLKADITFFGMPGEAVFDPHPAKSAAGDPPYHYLQPADDESIKDNILSATANNFSNNPINPYRPRVIGPEGGYDPASQLTFHIPQSNEVDRPDDWLYICPELDFSKLSFKVTIKDAEYASNVGDYYGDFANVEFIRREGNDIYDRNDGTDKYVLHAGETMSISITLYTGGGLGLSVVIDNWSTSQPSDADQYPREGFHLQDDLVAFAEGLQAATTEVERKALRDHYGIGEKGGPADNDAGGDYAVVEDENRYHLPLYTNMTLTGDSFTLGGDDEYDEYLVNGYGHTISFGGVGADYSVHICRMLDVYLTDGRNTVWIDPAGDIWIFDEKTADFKKTDFSLPAGLPDGKDSYTIDLETGRVS